jgi:hypothetical protein
VGDVTGLVVLQDRDLRDLEHRPRDRDRDWPDAIDVAALAGFGVARSSAAPSRWSRTSGDEGAVSPRISPTSASAT